MKCNSNLHQLGIGIQQYAQAFGRPLSVDVSRGHDQFMDRDRGAVFGKRG